MLGVIGKQLVYSPAVYRLAVGDLRPIVIADERSYNKRVTNKWKIHG
jgi:hypothetical protein